VDSKKRIRAMGGGKEWIPTPTATWMNFENITLREIRHSKGML
jgi:hypothetical protein